MYVVLQAMSSGKRCVDSCLKRSCRTTMWYLFHVVSRLKVLLCKDIRCRNNFRSYNFSLLVVTSLSVILSLDATWKSLVTQQYMQLCVLFDSAVPKLSTRAFTAHFRRVAHGNISRSMKQLLLHKKQCQKVQYMISCSGKDNNLIEYVGVIEGKENIRIRWYCYPKCDIVTLHIKCLKQYIMPIELLDCPSIWNVLLEQTRQSTPCPELPSFCHHCHSPNNTSYTNGQLLWSLCGQYLHQLSSL